MKIKIYAHYSPKHKLFITGCHYHIDRSITLKVSRNVFNAELVHYDTSKIDSEYRLKKYARKIFTFGGAQLFEPAVDVTSLTLSDFKPTLVELSFCAKYENDGAL